MERTPYQRKALVGWQNLKSSEASWSTFVRQYMRQWLVAVTGAIILGALFPDAAGLFAGIVLGVLARDLGYIRSIRAIWPVFLEFIDWTRLQRALDENRSGEKAG